MNFKHLRYFWTVAKAGGVMRAGEQLHTTPQTLSGQIRKLEEWLGHDLFRKRGRGLELPRARHGRDLRTFRGTGRCQPAHVRQRRLQP